METLGHVAQVGTIPMYTGADWQVKLEVPVGGITWPDGTTASIKFYNSTKTTVIYTKAGAVLSDSISFKIEYTDSDTIPNNAPFKIFVVIPTTPTTEAVLWVGQVDRKD